MAYQDEKGHFTSKENEGGPCHHGGGTRKGIDKGKYGEYDEHGKLIRELSAEEYKNHPGEAMSFDETVDDDFGFDEESGDYVAATDFNPEEMSDRTAVVENVPQGVLFNNDGEMQDLIDTFEVGITGDPENGYTITGRPGDIKSLYEAYDLQNEKLDINFRDGAWEPRGEDGKNTQLYYGGISEDTLRKSKDFKIKEYLQDLDEARKNPNKEFSGEVSEVQKKINQRLKQIKSVPNDIWGSDDMAEGGEEREAKDSPKLMKPTFLGPNGAPPKEWFEENFEEELSDEDYAEIVDAFKKIRARKDKNTESSGPRPDKQYNKGGYEHGNYYIVDGNGVWYIKDKDSNWTYSGTFSTDKEAEEFIDGHEDILRSKKPNKQR